MSFRITSIKRKLKIKYIENNNVLRHNKELSFTNPTKLELSFFI